MLYFILVLSDHCSCLSICIHDISLSSQTWFTHESKEHAFYVFIQVTEDTE